MKRIIYGTNNKSKIKYMRDMLSGMDLEIVGIGELGIELPHIDESGNNPIDNAVIKAKAYYDVINEPVFSADSGLYFSEVTDDEQPGTTVRRINGKRLSDSEMQRYYMLLSTKYGGRITAQYHNAMAVQIDKERTILCDDDGINSMPFYMVDKPYGEIADGFPLDSISIDITSGKYFNEIDIVRHSDEKQRAFREFFDKVIKSI